MLVALMELQSSHGVTLSCAGCQLHRVLHITTLHAPFFLVVQVLDNAGDTRFFRALLALSSRSHRTKFSNQVIKPLFGANLLEMTIQDKPRS